MKALIAFLLLSLCLCLATATSDIDLDASYSAQKWVTIQGAPVGSYPGRVVSNIGDFNGDGIDDMIMNAANSINSEVAYVIYGQKDGYSEDNIQVDSTFSEGFTIHGPFPASISRYTNFGFSIGKAIDLNGDGLSDIVIGAYVFSNYQGIVYVLYGKKGHTGDITMDQDLSFSSFRGFAIFGPQEGSQFGYAVGSAGDFNGDGFDDLIVGAPGGTAGYDVTGTAYVIYGKKGNYAANIYLNETQTGFAIFTPAESNYRLGYAVDGVGDINGDGIDDIIIGAPANYSVFGLYGKKNRVETTLTLDSNNVDTSKGFVISSDSSAGTFGSVLSSAGDIDNDGINDIILGTFLPYSTRGAFVFYGRTGNWPSFEIDESDLASRQGFMIKDSRSSEILSCGVAVSSGDFNGDGIGDLLVRARNKTIPSSVGGYVAVIYGSKTKFTADFDIATDLTQEAGFLVFGSTLNIITYATNSVAAGDLNGDGLPEILIGAPSSQSYNGEAYIVFGTNGCPKHCLTCESEQCLTCFKGYALDNSTSTCIECPAGTEISKDGTCQAKTLTTISAGLSCSSKSKERQATGYKGLFDAVSAISNVVALGSSMPTNFWLVSKILRNSKYLDIYASEDLQETFCAWKISTGIFPAPKDSHGSLPWVFERYGMKSAFLINYWKTLTIILLGLAVGLVCFIMSKTAFMKNTESEIPRVLTLMTFNFALAQFYGSVDEVLFDFVIDARSDGSTSSGFRTFGLIFGLLLLLTGFGVTGLHGVILFRYQRIKRKQGGSGVGAKVDFFLQFLKKYEKLKLFFKDFKDLGIFQQSFLLINITRSLLSSLIFTLLFDHPILQVSLLITLNLCVLLYLVIKKPFKSSSNAYAQCLCEGILFVAYLCILVLAIMAKAESGTESSIKGLSMVIIVCNAVLLIGTAVFMLVKTAGVLHLVYRKSSVSRKAVVPIPLDTTQKIAESPGKPNMDNSSGYFHNTSSSPNLNPRRSIRRGTAQRSTGSPIFVPTLIDNSPGLTQGGASLIHLNNNPNNLQNSERIQEESPLYGATSRNENDTVAVERGDAQSRLNRMRIQRMRRIYS